MPPRVPSIAAVQRPEPTARRGDAFVAAIAATRHGVVDYEDTDAAGLSRRSVRRRVGAGRLHRIHQGVFAVGHAGLEPIGFAAAALLACGPGHVLSHGTAAALWDLAPWPAVTHVTGTARHRLGDTVRYHEATTLQPWTRREGLPVTTIEALLLDLAETPGVPLLRLLSESLYRRRTTPERLEAHLVASPGRHGLTVIRSVLPYAGARHSLLEDDFHRLLRGAGLPEPETNRRVLGRQVDFWWPAERVVVETDGWAAHGTRTSFETDRDRDAALLAAGIRTMRITAHALATKPLVVTARLGAVLLSGRN